jgi:NAD(P)-dependent dehydrogenase (short-subunit alcohol dehydrogenase family)
MTKSWLITGSSRGFGRKLAEAVLASGDQLVATARRPEQLAGLVARYDDQVRAVPLDITDPVAAKAAVQTAVAAFGRLDILVNNAGYSDLGAIEETSLEEFRTLITTNLMGPIVVTKAALPIMHQQRSGHIIQFSSSGGRITTPGVAPYQTAKWGIEGFSGVLAKEVAPLGIKVTVIEPGSFRTDWAGSSMQIKPVGPDYEETVGAVAKRLRARLGQEPGDPAKAAQVILEIADMPEPPLQLLLGKGAFTMVDAADHDRLLENARWRYLTESTDFDLEDAAAAVRA